MSGLSRPQVLLPDDVGVLALDLGGVLLSDSTKTAFNAMAVRAGCSLDLVSSLWQGELRIPAELGEISSVEVFERFASVTGLAASEVAELLIGGFRPILEGVGVLEAAHALGVPVVLATNHLNEWLDLWAARFDWWALLDSVVCSAAVRERKPDAGFFREVVAAAGGRSGLVFVDDDPVNVDAAVRFGLRGVLASPGWSERLLAP